MRDAYHEELAAISGSLADLARRVSAAVRDATTAVLTADAAAAHRVIEGDAVVDELYHEIEERAFELLARQQPVATDLRLLVTSLRMVADIERAGDNALHIAKVARRRLPHSAVPDDLQPAIAAMGAAAERIMSKAADVVATRDVALARELEQDDDVMDDLHRRLFQTLLAGAWQEGIEAAVDITLVGRYYERFADHAVSVARRVVYLVTGERHVVAG